MINRAKCKLCNDIIESWLPDEIVPCKCGAIAVCDGAAMRMYPAGSPHFVRVDDRGNEIVVEYVTTKDNEEDHQSPQDKESKISTDEAIYALERSIEYNDSLPYHERYIPITTDEVNTYLKSILNIIRLMRQ